MRLYLVLGLLLALAVPVVPAAAQTEGLVAGQAVVAVVDTGINPYHYQFRDDSPRFQQHPSTYIPGFPVNAEALNLTFDAEDYDAAVLADCAEWAKVERGRLYWVPGTRIVGAASFLIGADPSCDPDDGTLQSPMILDTGGHGTMTASRVAAKDYGACPTCYVVAVQMPGSVNLLGPAGSEDGPVDAIEWAASQADWIDIQSNSWGPIAPAYDPTSATGLLTANPGFIADVESVSAAQPAFWASGNGAAFRGGVLGHPTPLTPHATPSAIMVGGHDSGYVNTWPGFPPHLVSDSCADWAANINTYDGEADDVGSGTSSATPFVAGGGAAILASARAILGDTSTGQGVGTGTPDAVMAEGPAGLVPDGPLANGVLTRGEWLRILYTTATARPTAQYEDGPQCDVTWAPYNATPVQWSQVPAGYPEYLHIGYGAVDDPALALAQQVLEGTAPMPDRSATDTYFGYDDTIGQQTHAVYTLPAAD